MRSDRNPYPFHHRQPQAPAISYGYRPAPPRTRKRTLFAGAAGYLFFIGTAGLALAGFLAH